MDQWLRVYLTSPAGDEVELSTLNTYNGYKLLDGVRGFGIPKRSLETVAVEGAGSILQSQRFDESEMMLPVAVRADTEDEVATLVRALENVLAPASDEPIVIRVEAPGLGTVRRRRAYYVEGLEGALGGADQYGPWRHMQVKLNALDPVWFGETRTITEAVKSQRKPFISTVGTTKPVNLLPNGSFEKGINQTPTKLANGGRARSTISTDWSMSGSQSLKVTPNGSDSNSSAYVWQGNNAPALAAQKAFSLVPGGTYTFGATLHIEGVQTGSLRDNSRTISVGYTPDQGTTWTYLAFSTQAPNVAGSYNQEVTFVAPTDGPIILRLYNGSASTPVYWDDLYLYEGSPTDTRQTVYRTNLALNPGCEDGVEGFRTPNDLVELASYANDKVSGSQSLQATVVDASSTPGLATNYQETPGVADSPYTLTFMGKASPAVSYFKIECWEYRKYYKGDTQLRTETVQIARQTSQATGQWLQYQLRATLPKLNMSGVTSVKRMLSWRINLVTSIGGSVQPAAVGEWGLFDEFLVENQAYAGSWFSGDSKAPGKTYKWNPDGSSQEAAKSTTGAVPFFPIRLSGSSVQGEYDLDIGGDLPTWGVYTITGPGKDPVLTCGDKTMAISGDVTEPVTIDMNPRVADITTPTLQSGEMWDRAGTVVAGQIEDADFWQLEPGTVHLGMSMVDATNVSTIRVDYTERWLAAY